MSTLKVNTIQDTTGNDALTIDSSGNVTASQGFVPSTQLSHRNLIINGAMNVAQRGTSFSVTTSRTYTLDRFSAECDSSGMTVSQDTETPPNFKYSLKCLNGTGSASSGDEGNYISYIVEGYDGYPLGAGTSDAKTVTLSFWARSSITGTYIVGFTDSGRDNGYPASYTINTADTWEHKTITLPMSTYSGWVGNGTNGKVLQLIWDLGSGSDRDLPTVNAWNDGSSNDWTHSSQTDWVATTGATFYLTGVQLEVGSVATPFEHRSYGEELARCQRYYYEITHDSTNRWGIDGLYSSGTGADLNFSWTHPTTMRTDPTFTPALSISDTTYYPRKEFMNIQLTNRAAGRCSAEFASGTSKWDAEL